MVTQKPHLENNTMAKRQKGKKTTNDRQNISHNLKIAQHESH